MSLYMKTRGRKERKPESKHFVVGHDIHGGERVQWLVEGGKVQSELSTAERARAAGE